MRRECSVRPMRAAEGVARFRFASGMRAMSAAADEGEFMNFVSSLRRAVPAMRRGCIAAAAIAFTVALLSGVPAAHADPHGACCLADGSCEFVFNFECDDEGEVYQGNDVPCAEVSCPQPPTTTTLEPTTTTSSTTSTTSTTMAITGACC